MSPLSKNLKHLLDAGKLTQPYVAEKTGVQQGTISKIKTGKLPDPGYQSVLALARFFGVTVDDLVTRDLATEASTTQAESQPANLDPKIMSSALVSVKEAMDYFKVPQGRLYEIPSVVIFAYHHRSTYPAELSKAQYAVFDESVRNSLKGALYDLGQISGGAAKGRGTGTRKGAAPKQAVGGGNR